MSFNQSSRRTPCPICGKTNGNCRTPKDGNAFWMCMTFVGSSKDESINGWDYIGDTRDGMWGMFVPSDSPSPTHSDSDWQQRQLERSLERQREKEELLQGALPAPQRDEAIRRLHKHFGISSKHRQKLRDRGLCDEHIDSLPYFSIHPGQAVPPFTPANLPGVSRGKLTVKREGFTCPIPDVDGRYIGWQNRFDEGEPKYTWASGDTSSHLPNGELPIGVYRPDGAVTRRAIGMAEGFLKPDIIAQLWGLPTLGAASANFASSPEQTKASLDRLSGELWTRTVYWFADAGAVSNPHVNSQYQRSWEILTEWGYQIQVVWYGQIEKSALDADEISPELRESARLISIDEYQAIALSHGGIRELPTQNRTIDRDEWELKFGTGPQILKRLKRLLNWQKSAEGCGKELPPIQPAQKPTLKYHPDKPLPKPEDYAGRELPKIIFEEGQRLEVLTKLKQLGWKVIGDRSFTGSGKSHDAGSLHPDPDGTNKIWYFDINHTNPSTEPIENMANMPPRHNGMVEVPGKQTPKGNPHLQWAKGDEGAEVPITPSLCHNAELFIKLKSKGWNVDLEKEAVKGEDGKTSARNPICKQCRFAFKCHSEVGDGYGYLHQRRETMEFRRIRASLDSAPNPGKGDGSYDYSEDTAFVEEASRQIKGIETLTANAGQLAQLWGYVERKAPEAFEALQPIRFALQDALAGKFDCLEKGRNRGADHEALVNEFPRPDAIANLPSLLQQVKEAMPTIKDVVEEPDSVTGLGGKWRTIGQFARDMFKVQAAQETKQNIDSLPPNVLVDALEVWAGIKPGSLRVLGGKLHVTIPDTRHADILSACGFVVLLDATPDSQKLQKILGDSILEIEQERPPAANLTVFSVNLAGMGSRQISESCKSRQLALLDWIRQQHQGVKVLANKADEHLPLDGWWFNDNRGSNAFKGVEAIAAFGTPRPNLGAVADEYRALFGSLEGFQEYYQRLGQAEIIQLIGRQRAHLYPDKSFTLYLTSTNQDSSFLEHYGVRVESREAFQLTPLAGTPDQVTRWKILQAVGQLQNQGQKITQDAIASVIGKSQELISKIAREFGGWKPFKKLLLVLLGLYRGGNNFEPPTAEEEFLAKTYLPGVLNDPDEQVISEIAKIVSIYGWDAFARIVGTVPLHDQARMLAVVLGMLPLELVRTAFTEMLPADQQAIN